jgi:hypothetical protein
MNIPGAGIHKRFVDAEIQISSKPKLPFSRGWIHSCPWQNGCALFLIMTGFGNRKTIFQGGK